jgi:endonuclease-3
MNSLKQLAQNYWSLNIQQKANFVLAQLTLDYPTVSTPLMHSNAYELLISVMLSPQTNDVTTNKVTPILFTKYPTPLDLSKAKLEDVTKIIRVINYHRTKAQRIINAARMIVEEFDNKIPWQIDELLRIPGVGRKIANVIISDWYSFNPQVENTEMIGEPVSDKYNSIPRGSIEPNGFVVDTHVTRIANVLGLTKTKNADKIEQDLMKLFPSKEWRAMSLRMIFHGREVFQAKKPEFEKHEIWRIVYSNKV